MQDKLWRVNPFQIGRHIAKKAASIYGWYYRTDGLSHEFVEQAQQKGVLVRSADDYRAGQQIPLPAVRLCLSRPKTHIELLKALNILKNILEQGPLLKEAVM